MPKTNSLTPHNHKFANHAAVVSHMVPSLSNCGFVLILLKKYIFSISSIFKIDFLILAIQVIWNASLKISINSTEKNERLGTEMNLDGTDFRL